MFTGDRSGDWLFRAMFRAGFANQATSNRRDDGLELLDAWVTAPVRCAPPGNRPTTEERDACSGWFDEELGLLAALRVAVCLGGYGYQALWSALRRRGAPLPSPRPKFGHGVRVQVDDLTLMLSYHPSQQNTFTGRLTEAMFDEVFTAARAEIASGGSALG
jgi:uracil-DNA glycosylase